MENERENENERERDVDIVTWEVVVARERIEEVQLQVVNVLLTPVHGPLDPNDTQTYVYTLYYFLFI